MVLSENWHSPIEFWLKLPIPQLIQWLHDSNNIIAERNREAERRRKKHR